ncbi:zinc-binding metallopeptidase family protein [Mangrovibrevibacter kandeliae]|uniref:zinc-binding metallopeptidase family protein n=1 Tax=Mangrovibrevibacter kandeliae TaxID=2968473 RepID=UPI0021179875|nr:putative zinc-binding peptidase [Aurantimonas sp. CSK15Z-1]MCQ8780611.1 putative zinc-binding peptidase [Aurantimonas sp. CSK15Z-1]
MKLFSCPFCDQVAFFANVVCERCGHALGFEPQDLAMLALEPEGGIWTEAGKGASERRWRYCENFTHGVCNWLVPAEGTDALCLACRHNLVIPNLSDANNVLLWGKMEAAKHRLFYTLLRLKLPLVTRDEHPEGLGFEFLSDEGGEAVMTGHDNGLITIALAEADDAEREKRRAAMGEPYRTLLGHFRHEIGHWYWDRLVRDGGALAECRAMFGNDEEDYGEALQRHYANGPKPNWQDEYVSSYAGAHAWEDFAETWAHYLHIVETMNTGHSWGVTVSPRIPENDLLRTRLDFDVFDPQVSITQITDAWLPLAMALNSFNRAMGQQDLYPFVLGPKVIEKLGFIHDLVHGRVGHALGAGTEVLVTGQRGPAAIQRERRRSLWPFGGN